MSPTRPVDNGPSSSTAPKVGSAHTSTARGNSAQASGAPAAAQSPAPSGSGGATDSVAASVTAHGELQEAAREIAGVVGQERIEALKEQIREGTFEVDTAALADRLLADAFGYELYLQKGGGKENS